MNQLTDSKQTDIMLTTKLHRPCTNHHLVQRPHLIEQLNNGLDRKLALLSAPAGFGKTTLLSMWLENGRLPAAWLSLDESDNDLNRFVAYFIAAIQTVFPEAGAMTLSQLQHDAPSSWLDLTTALINDLVQLATPFVIVLDDYHHIQAEAIHQTIGKLLDNLPTQMQIVIATRVPPPLPLARLRVQQQTVEMNAQDLRFTLAETQVFSKQTVGAQLEAKTVSALHERTEGWAAGLQFAFMALRKTDDQVTFVNEFKSCAGQNVMDFLRDEVFTHLPQAIKEFLWRTSILDRFCAPLCDAILDQDAETGDTGISTNIAPASTGQLFPHSSQEIIAQLKATNLFIVSLDNEGHWYRYHHLFRAFLQQTLHEQFSQEDMASYHARAAAWLAHNGHIDEAITQVLSGEDVSAKIQLVEQNFHDALDREAWSTLAQWLSRLPVSMIQQRPALLLAEAWLLQFQDRLAEVSSRLQEAQRLLDNHKTGLSSADKQALRGEMDALWSGLYFRKNEAQRSLKYAQRALDNIDVDAGFIRGYAFFYLGLAAQSVGQGEMGIAQLNKVLNDQQVASKAVFTSHVLLSLATVYWTSGELYKVARTAEAALRLATQENLPASLGRAHHLLGLVHYEWNDLDTAVRHFCAVTNNRHLVPYNVLQESMLAQALAYQAQERHDEAHKTADHLHEYAWKTNNRDCLMMAHALRARLFLEQGDLAKAAHWSKMADLDADGESTHTYTAAQLAQVQLLITRGTERCLRQATQQLQSLSTVAQATHNSRRIIEIMIWQALVLQKQGRRNMARDVLRQAVMQARPGNFIRTFVDAGTAVPGLLCQITNWRAEADYVRRLLAAFPKPMEVNESAWLKEPSTMDRIYEQLTEREYEVLALLNKRLSNKEIAQMLIISPLTVKKHTINIYKKLDVNSRRQAVAKARSLGILFQSQVMFAHAAD